MPPAQKKSQVETTEKGPGRKKKILLEIKIHVNNRVKASGERNHLFLQKNELNKYIHNKKITGNSDTGNSEEDEYMSKRKRGEKLEQQIENERKRNEKRKKS